MWFKTLQSILLEKISVICANPNTLLNEITELIYLRHHRNNFLLTNFTLILEFWQLLFTKDWLEIRKLEIASSKSGDWEGVRDIKFDTNVSNKM